MKYHKLELYLILRGPHLATIKYEIMCANFCKRLYLFEKRAVALQEDVWELVLDCGRFRQFTFI